MRAEMKRVGIYARVSTKDQTAENQLLDLRKYCEARGWQIVAECVDNGISGTKDDRPQLKAVMELARKRKIDVLLTWRLDRVSRSMAHLSRTLEELNALGVDFVSYGESIDTTTPQGKLFYHISGAFAEFERALIVERVLSGLRRAKAHGKRLGRPQVVRDNTEALSLKDGGLSVRAIAFKLGTSKSAVSRMLSQQSPIKVA